MSEINHEGTAQIVCPYCGHGCGYLYTDRWDIDEEGDMECKNCHNEFIYEQKVYVDYRTRKKEDGR